MTTALQSFQSPTPVRVTLAIAALFFLLPSLARAQITPQPNDGQPATQNPAVNPAPNSDSTGEADDKPQQPGTPPDQPQPSLLTPLKVRREDAPYSPISPRQRLRWFITNSIGPSHLFGGAITSALGTALDRPKEYGPHWGGFADRNGMRMTGIVTGNAMEAGIGYAMHEDPRYFRVPDRPFKSRLSNVVKMTFLARQYDGTYGLAYARYIAISGNNFLSNSWRVSSEANTHDAFLRTGEGFAGRMAANAFEEFWPDMKRRVFHKRQ